MFCVKKKGDIHQAAASTMLNDTLHHKLQSHNMNTITIQARAHSRLKSHLLQTNWFQPQDVASLSCVCTKAHLGLMWAAFGMYRSITVWWMFCGREVAQMSHMASGQFTGHLWLSWGRRWEPHVAQRKWQMCHICAKITSESRTIELDDLSVHHHDNMLTHTIPQKCGLICC